MPSPGSALAPGAAPAPASRFPGAGPFPTVPSPGAPPYPAPALAPGAAPYLGPGVAPAAPSPASPFPGVGTYPASAMRPSAGRPSMQEAVRQVFGPSTEHTVSHAASGLLAFSMIALLVSAVATAGVVLPSHGFAPLGSGAGSAAAPSGKRQATSTPSPAPISIAGTWAMIASNCTPVSGVNACPDLPGSGSWSVVISQNGSHITVNDGSTANPTGTISGQTFTATSYDPASTCTTTYSGTVLAPDRIRGTFDFGCTGGQAPGSFQWDLTATRTSP
jgi:hypothetical protein